MIFSVVYMAVAMLHEGVGFILFVFLPKMQMRVHGMHGLLLSFLDACKNVLARYRPPTWGDFLRRVFFIDRPVKVLLDEKI